MAPGGRGASDDAPAPWKQMPRGTSFSRAGRQTNPLESAVNQSGAFAMSTVFRSLPGAGTRRRFAPGSALAAALLAVALEMFAAGARADDTGYLIRETEIKAKPAGDSDTVATLRERARVDIVRRQGAWLEIKSEAGSGWVRMLGVRRGSASASGSSSSGFASIFNVARTGSSGTGIATGVRGLDKEQIKNATPNPAELDKLNDYAVSSDDAQRFAAQANLAERRIDYVAATSAH